MKAIKLIIIALCATAFASCNDTGNSQQALPSTSGQQVSQAAQPSAQPSVQPSAAAPAANAQALPETITSFLNKHFPGASVVGVETDNEHGGLEYDVYLNDGTEVDFDRTNQWEKVDCKTKAVPASVVPQAIASYVKTNYQSIAIVKIDNKGYGYEVKLANGMDLKFGQNGQFVGIDD